MTWMTVVSTRSCACDIGDWQLIFAFRDLGALFHTGPASSQKAATPEPGCEARGGDAYPKLSIVSMKKTRTPAWQIINYTVWFIKRWLALVTRETAHEKPLSRLKSVGGKTMHKFFLALTLLSVPAATDALAHSGTAQDEKACAPAGARLCRKLMDRDDPTILACLKDNRPKLSPACRCVLVSHGQ